MNSRKNLRGNWTNSFNEKYRNAELLNIECFVLTRGNSLELEHGMR